MGRMGRVVVSEEREASLQEKKKGVQWVKEKNG